MILHGDCLVMMDTFIESNSVDAIITDPPYELGFMGKSWDASGVAYNVDVWRECLRVLKPGGHLLAFSGSRTYHRMTCAIEDAGFEIRDQIMWVYGSGFPKSLDVSKAIDKAAGHTRASEYEPNFKNGTFGKGMGGGKHGAESEPPVTAAAAAAAWQGWGTALKPAHEPICVARKPLAAGTVAANVLAHGTGALNIDGCRVGDFVNTTPSGVDRRNAALAEAGYRPGAYQMGEKTPSGAPGRWPANLIHDGSEEVVALFPSQAGASAARFFYCAKASKKDRGEGNNHPTVKPTDLMRYLARLVTPPGGLIIDPFAGSGSTGKAAVLEGFKFIGIEMQAEYVEIALARIKEAA